MPHIIPCWRRAVEDNWSNQAYQIEKGTNITMVSVCATPPACTY